MTIKILVFGVAKEIVGGTSVDISMEEKIKVNDLRRILELQYPALGRLSSYMIALNNEYANGEEEITGRDEIAIIPPVSGG